MTYQDQTDTTMQQENPPDFVAPYSFGASQRVPEAHLRELKEVQQRFCRDFAAAVGALTRRTIKPCGVSCAQMEPGQLLGQLAESGLLLLVEVHPLNDWLMVRLDWGLVSALLEALLGGRVSGSNNSARELTEIELSVLQDLHGVIAGELEKAWRAVAKFTFLVVEQQPNRRAGRLTSLAGHLVLSTIELEVEGSAGQMIFCYPLQMARVFQGADEAARSSDLRRPEAIQQAVFGRLKSSPLTIEGYLRGGTLKLRDLLDLRGGDVLNLETPLDRPLDVTVNGAPRFTGRITLAGLKKAIRIHDVLRAAKARPKRTR